MNSKEKVVIITGAASGIGAATALKFAELSAQLSLVDKNEDGLKSSLRLCEAKSKKKHLSIVADLSNKEDVLRVIPETIKRYGKIDTLVNCAGIYVLANVLDEDISDVYEKVMAINVRAPIILCNKAAPYLVVTKGSVINITSTAGCVPIYSLYGASKAGLEMFTKCMAKELASKGVRVNSILPGCVRTNICKNYDETIDLEKYYAEQENLRPFGVIEPSEVANLVVFLTSEGARSITGSSYIIDGGYRQLYL